MPEFLAETYTPRPAPGTPAPCPACGARAAAHANSPQAQHSGGQHPLRLADGRK